MRTIASLRIRRLPGRRSVTGDDVLEDDFSEPYKAELESLGCRVKEYSRSRVFMGTDFAGPPVPVYFDKHVVNYWTSGTNKEERLDSYARLWCHDEAKFNFWKSVASAAGFTLKSRAYYKFWYDNPLAKTLCRLFE